jgi:hypothetical protein
MGIRADMRIQQICFAVFDDSIRIFEIGLAFANGLNFGSPERDAGLELVEQKVIMRRGAIDCGVSLSSGDRFSRLRFLRGWSSVLTRLAGHTFGYESSC